LIARLQEERWRLAYGVPVPARGLLLGDYLKQWLDVMRSQLRPKTFDAYELCVHRANRTLGSVPLVRLTPQLIQRTYAELLATGLSPRTVFHTHAVLHRALKRARHWELIDRIPSELVAPPRAPYREMKTLTAPQLQKLFDGSRDNRWHQLESAVGGAWHRWSSDRRGVGPQME
jgi:site-specific recombinase XerD